MLQILRRIPFSKLYTFLIVLLLVPTLVLAYQYFTTGKSPFFQEKQYVSVVNFDQQKINQIPQDAIILGRGIPQSSTEIIINPNLISTKLETDNKGYWIYSLSKDFPAGNYWLTSFIKDSLANLNSINSYKLLVYHKNSNPFRNLNLDEFIPKAKSQTTAIGSDWNTWVQMMKTQGVTPMQVEGEIILMSNEVAKRYCQNNPCFISPPTPSETRAVLESDRDFLLQLMLELLYAGYDPLDSLDDYFLNIRQDEQINVYFSQRVRTRDPFRPLATTIDEQTLNNLIIKFATEEGFREKSPLRIFLAATDPILGLQSIIDWATLPPSKVSDEKRLQALMGVTLIYGMSTKVTVGGFNLAKNTAINLGLVADDAGVIARALKAGQEIPLTALKPQARSWIIEEMPPPIPKSMSGKFLLDDSMITRYGYQNVQNVFSYIKLAGPQGKLAILDEVTRRRIRDDLLQAVIDFERRTGRSLQGIKDSEFVSVLNEGRTFILNDDVFAQSYAATGDKGRTPAGYAYRDFFVLKKSQFQIGRFRNHLAYHESTHILQAEKPTFNLPYYEGIEQSRIYKTLNIIMEQMTDYWADLARGIAPFSSESRVASFYAGVNPYIQAGIRKLLTLHPDLLDDFLQFGLDRNGTDLIKAVAAKTGRQATPEEFVQWFRERTRIDVNKIVQIGFTGVMGLELGTVAPDVLHVDPSYEVVGDPVADDEEVTITNIQGNGQPGAELKVTSIVSESGVASNKNEYDFTYTLEPQIQSQNIYFPLAFAQQAEEDAPESIDDVVPLTDGKHCQDVCTVTLPATLSPGNYRIAVYLAKEGSDKILATDSYPLTITLSQTNTNDSIVIPPVYDQETIDVSFLNLDQTEATPTIPEEPLDININVPPSTPDVVCVTDEDYSVFRGCDPTTCGKEFWNCPAGDKLKSFDSPENGDCACKTDEAASPTPTLTLTSTEESQPTPTEYVQPTETIPTDFPLEEQPTDIPSPTESPSEEAVPTATELLVDIIVNDDYDNPRHIGEEFEIDLEKLGAQAGQPSFVLVKIVVRYDSGRESEPDYLAFDYQPSQAPGGQEPATPTEASQPTAPSQCEQHFQGCVPNKCGYDIYVCDDGSNYEERYTPGGDCKDYVHNEFCPTPTEAPVPTQPEEGVVDCPSDMWYNQCGGTAGLEDESFDRSHTYQIIPQCNQGTRDIVGYRNDDRGNQGQCCENVYYWDDVFKDPPMCIRKYSPESAFPNCSYAFGDVEGHTQASCGALN
ncbi:MAG: hypothetical protein HY429_00980 [Candidatus Levybacteria bacterium]|nr:hypothetical protein [Candidatus Levybacteria bacterium]